MAIRDPHTGKFIKGSNTTPETPNITPTPTPTITHSIPKQMNSTQNVKAFKNNISAEDQITIRKLIHQDFDEAVTCYGICTDAMLENLGSIAGNDFCNVFDHYAKLKLDHLFPVVKRAAAFLKSEYAASLAKVDSKVFCYDSWETAIVLRYMSYFNDIYFYDSSWISNKNTDNK